MEKKWVILLAVVIVLLFLYFRFSRVKQKSYEELKAEVLAIANTYGISEREKRKLKRRLRRDKDLLVEMQNPLKYFLSNVKI